jgi:hypothetical protein
MQYPQRMVARATLGADLRTFFWIQFRIINSTTAILYSCGPRRASEGQPNRYPTIASFRRPLHCGRPMYRPRQQIPSACGYRTPLEDGSHCNRCAMLLFRDLHLESTRTNASHSFMAKTLRNHRPQGHIIPRWNRVVCLSAVVSGLELRIRKRLKIWRCQPRLRHIRPGRQSATRGFESGRGLAPPSLSAAPGRLSTTTAWTSADVMIGLNVHEFYQSHDVDTALPVME